MSLTVRQFDGISVLRPNVSETNHVLAVLSRFLRTTQKSLGRVNCMEVANVLAGNKTIVAAQVHDLFETLDSAPDQGVIAMLAMLDDVEFDNQDTKARIKQTLLGELQAPMTHYTNPDSIAKEIADAKTALDANRAAVVDVTALAHSLEQAIENDVQTTEDGAELESFTAPTDADEEGLFEPFRPGN